MNRLVNKLLLGVGVWNENVDDASNSPGLVVLGTFSGGGAQATRHEQNTTAYIVDVAVLSAGKHTVKCGGGLEPRYVSIFNVANLNLTDFILDRPSLYALSVGPPQISLNQYNFYAFVQANTDCDQPPLSPAEFGVNGSPTSVTAGFDNNHDTVTYRIGKDPKSSRRLEVRVDAFNFLNHVNFKNYVGIMTSPYFGTAGSAQPGRQQHFSIKFCF